MLEAADPNLILIKHKAISALLPYAVHLAKSGDRWLFDLVLHVASASNSGEFMWHHIGPHISALFDKPTSPSLNLVLAFASLPYTEVIGQIVVSALLQIASIDSLRPHIPVAIWAWLKKQPHLPCEWLRQSEWTRGDVVHYVRSLGDIEILKSYLLLAWSDPDGVDGWLGGLNEMQVSIREDFNGIGMVHHREDLIRQLNDSLGLGESENEELSIEQPPPVALFTPTPSYQEAMQYGGVVPPSLTPSITSGHQRAMEQYSKLKAVLLEVDEEAMDILTGMPPKLILFSLLTHRHIQDPI